MASTKLVKSLVLLILFSADMRHINGMRANNDEAELPAAHIVYDQRQSGKYNIHVVIKDVAIIEMDQNEVAEQTYNDEEYYYDEDDLTVKPLNIKSSTTSIKPFFNTRTPLVQTTISPADVTTSNDTEETSTSNTNTSNTNQKKFQNNVEDVMTFFSTHRPAVDTKSRSKVEPIYAIEEPVIKSKHQLENLNYDMPAQLQSRHSTLKNQDSYIFPNSRIFKVKVHRSHRAPQIVAQRQQRCRSNQNRDSGGNCHGKRSSSSSILKRLFRTLVTLPFKQDEQQLDD